MAGCEILYDPHSVHLPPDEAWRVDPEKIGKFYAPTDDRGFVMPDATVETILTLFHDDYVWPVDRHDQRFAPDLHHFQFDEADYQPENFNGSTVPRTFRELATRKGILPRQFHNVLHFVTHKPLMPDIEHMEAHIDAYLLARRLFVAADRLMVAQYGFEVRKADKLRTETEIVNGKVFLTDQFKAHFRGYNEILDLVAELPGDDEILPNIEELIRIRLPHRTIRHLGHIARQTMLTPRMNDRSKYVKQASSINFVPLFSKLAA